jgi:putative ABC transport system ATP-binding protein
MALFQDLGRSGITIVLVTHEPDIATYASRVIVLKDGMVSSDSTQVPADAREEVERNAATQVPA